MSATAASDSAARARTASSVLMNVIQPPRKRVADWISGNKKPLGRDEGLHAVPPCFAAEAARSMTALRRSTPVRMGVQDDYAALRPSPSGSEGNFTSVHPRRLAVGGHPFLGGA